MKPKTMGMLALAATLAGCATVPANPERQNEREALREKQSAEVQYNMAVKSEEAAKTRYDEATKSRQDAELALQEANQNLQETLGIH